MSNSTADDSKKTDDEVQQKIITPIEKELKSFKTGLTNNKKDLTKLDESVKLKLDRCQESLKKNIGTFPKIGKLLAVPFALSGLVTLVIWISLGVDKSIDWIIGNSSFSNTSKFLHIFGIFICFVVFSVLSVFCFYFFIIRKQYNNSLHDIETNSIDTEKSHFETIIKGIEFAADGTEDFFKSKITLFGDINDKIKSEREWDLKCEKMSMVITFFGLQNELENTIVDLKKNPPNNSDKKTIIDHICEKAPFNSTLMHLLASYYDGESNDVEIYWKEVKNDNKLLDQIVSIIHNLRIFNLYSNIDRLDKNILSVNELKQILLKSQEFDKSLITDNVLLYTRVYKHLLNYREKLFKESQKSLNKMIYSKKELTKLEVIYYLNFDHDFVSNFIDIFSRELSESLEVKSKNAYIDALMAILLSPDISLREKVCIRASENYEAIYVLMVYYDLREQRGASNEQFSLFDIIDEGKVTAIKEKIKNNDNRKYEILFKQLKLALSNGEWCESSQAIIQSKVDEILDKLDKNEKNERVIGLFTKYFTKIKINTLDMAVDAGLFTIYLILVPKSEGPFLRGVIDKLSVSIPENKYLNKNTKKKDDSIRDFNYTTIRRFEKDHFVSLFFDSDVSEPKIPMYDFETYSFATRIGIAHREISFTAFVDRFNKDVEKVLRKIVEENPSQEWEKITFIILRISPSEYSFGLMSDKISIEGVKSFGNLDLAEKIATLASPYLTEQDKTAIATFENDISFSDIFEKMTIFEILSSNTRKNVKKYSAFLNGKDFNILIKENLKAYDIESFRQLSSRLFLHPDTYNELKESLSSLITEENKKKEGSPMSKYTAYDIASDFLESIKAMHDVWTHEAFK